uniref:Uncharacterized protein n=1 Tax=Heterorhabditis bacteriophora TaxID=37862 RepID=A0A1I7WJ85_HETBA
MPMSSREWFDINSYVIVFAPIRESLSVFLCEEIPLLSSGSLRHLTIVAELPSDEFVNKEYGEMKDASWRLNGTDPALLFPLRMIYTTRPTQHFLVAFRNDR